MRPAALSPATWILATACAVAVALPASADALPPPIPTEPVGAGATPSPSPLEETFMVFRITFGLKDEAPRAWDGRIPTVGSGVRAVAPDRFRRWPEMLLIP